MQYRRGEEQNLSRMSDWKCEEMDEGIGYISISGGDIEVVQQRDVGTLFPPRIRPSRGYFPWDQIFIVSEI